MYVFLDVVHVHITLQTVSTDTAHVQASLQIDHAALHLLVSCGARALSIQFKSVK